MKTYKEVITSVIKELGIPANLKGYHCIRCAVELLINDISLIGSITKVIYPTVAKRFNTTTTGAERAIRHAIETGWGRVNEDVAMRLFGYSVSANIGKPTNREFLATVADYILVTHCPGTEEANHGTWLPQIVSGIKAWDCSECKTLGSPHWKRCPICEAKMDGGNAE